MYHTNAKMLILGETKGTGKVRRYGILYILPNFSVNLKLFQKLKPINLKRKLN